MNARNAKWRRRDRRGHKWLL